MQEDENQAVSGKKQQMIVGEDLSAFSVNELTGRLTALKNEITRVEACIKQKQSQAQAAENLFKSETEL